MEDTAPILCRKIRYYRVPALRNRIRRPPVVPAVSIERGSVRPGCMTSTGASEASPVPQGAPVEAPRAGGAGRTEPAAETVQVREATVADLEREESLTLEDYETDFSQVPMPDHEGPVSDVELERAVAGFLETLSR
jgi:hypothetical protein